MEKINFINQSTPAVNATNLNKLQDNVEDAIQEVQDDVDSKLDISNIKTAETTSNTDTYSCNYINGIVESGNNANGNYIKYIDGTMICTRNIEISNASASSTWGSLYYYSDSTSYSFASEFISTPIIQKTFVATDSVGAILGDYGNSNVTTANFKGITLIRPSSGNITGNIYVTAIGRWK